MSLLHGILKLALNRETALRQTGSFSPGDEAKLLDFHRANYAPGQNERFIRHLGHGATSNVDLVYHPQHGYQARKALRANIPLEELQTDKNMQIWDDISKYQQANGPSGFAQVREVTPEKLVFQDVAQGPSMSQVKPHAAQADKLWKVYKHLHGRVPEDKRFMDLAHKYHQKVFAPASVRAREPIASAKLHPDLQKMVGTLRQKYPQLNDFNTPWNVHSTPEGPVSIDISASRKGTLNGVVPSPSTKVTPQSNAQFLGRAKRLAQLAL
jgi:hypothetical protein